MTALKAASLWFVAALLVIVAGSFFASVTATQLTSEDTSERVLRRSVAAMTEVDAVLPRIDADLHTAATTTEGPTVRVPNWPIAIDLPREEAATLSGAELRDRLLTESADQIYHDGMSVWTGDDPAAVQDFERASAAGLVDQGLSLARDDVHTAFLVVSVLLGVLAASMTVALLVVLPRDAKLIVMGSVVLISALPALAAAVALRFAFRTAGSDGDAFVDAMLDIGADSMWIPIRNFFTLTVLGGGLFGGGAALLWWESRETNRHSPMADTTGV